MGGSVGWWVSRSVGGWVGVWVAPSSSSVILALKFDMDVTVWIIVAAD